jgi:hypothetical protein
VTGDYASYAARLAGIPGIGSVEVWDSDYLIAGDGWSLATFEPVPGGGIRLLVNKVVFDALETRGPPAGFEPALGPAERNLRFAELIAQHELAEHAALSEGHSVLYKRFTAYLKKEFPESVEENRTADRFHAYLRTLATTGSMVLEEEALRAQPQLLAFAVQTAGAQQAGGRVRTTLAAIEDGLYAILNREFEREIRMRQGFRICREASYITAQVLSGLLGLPIGGNAPDRIELMTGTVLDEHGRPIELHRWIAVYENGRKTLLLDPTYAQFDPSFKDRFLVGPYDETLTRYRYLEWDGLFAHEMKRQARFGATRDEVITNLTASYEYMRSIDPFVPVPFLIFLAEVEEEVMKVRNGTKLDRDLEQDVAKKEKMDALAAQLVQTHRPAESRVAVVSAPRAAGSLIRETGAGLIPSGAARGLAEMVVENANSETIRHPAVPGMLGRTFIGVYETVTRRDIEQLGALNAMGIPALAVVPGRPGPGAEYLCTLTAQLPGRTRPVPMKVMAADRGAVILYLDVPELPGDAAGTAALFGRGVLKLLDRIAGDDKYLQPRLRGLGLSFASFRPDVVELHGEFAAFAHPALVRDDLSERFGNTVFGFVSTGGPAVVGIAGASVAGLPVTRRCFEDASRGGTMDLTRACLALADVAAVSEDVKKANPWLPDGVTLDTIYPAESAPAAIERRIRLYDAGVSLRQARSVMRSQSTVAATATLAQLGSAGARGSVSDLGKHIDELKEIWIGIVQLRSLLDRETLFALNGDIVDWTILPELASEQGLVARLTEAQPGSADEAGALTEAYRRFAATGSRERKERFDGFCRQHRAWLEPYARAKAGATGDAVAYQYLQFVATQQLRIAVDEARRKEAVLLFDCVLRPGADAGRLQSAIAYWLRFGFGGVRVDLSAYGSMPAAWLTELKGTVDRIAPDAVVTIVPPAGAKEAAREVCGALGFKMVESYVPGSLPADIVVDENVWLEMAIPEGTAVSVTDAAAAREWIRELLESGAPYVALPDALQWGGDVAEGAGFRNPGKGERYFDITDAVLEMVRRRAGMAPAARLCGWQYRDAYGDGFAVPLPGVEAFDWGSFNAVREFRLGANGAMVRAPGLHALRVAARRLRADETAGAEALRHHAARNDLFAFTYAALGGTRGLRETEWPAGWHYLRALERQVYSTADIDRKVEGNLRLLSFVRGLTDHLLEVRYCAARGITADQLPAGENDRSLFRTLLAAADVKGVDLTGIGDADGSEAVPPAAARYLAAHTAGSDALVHLPDAETGIRASVLYDAKSELHAIDGRTPAAIVGAAVYVRAFVRIMGEQKTVDECRPEIREMVRALLPVLTVGTVDAADADEEAAVSWAVAGLLGTFALFEDTERRVFDTEKAVGAAVDPLGIKRIKAAG